MGLMDMFRSSAPAPQATSTQGGTNQEMLAQQPQIPGSGATAKSDGSVPAIPKAAEGDKSPMSEFTNLWEAPKEGEQRGVPSSVPAFTLDPKTLQATAEQLDVGGQFTDDELKTIFGENSNPAAARVFANKIGQMTFKNGYAAAAKTIESAMTISDRNLKDKVLPEFNRRGQVAEALSTDPFFTNPATQPLIRSLQAQFADKHPKASASEIQDMVVRYVDGMSEARVQQRGFELVKPQKAKGDNIDWDAWATQSTFDA